MQRFTVLSTMFVLLLFSSRISAQSSISNDSVVPIKLYQGYLIIVQGRLGNLEKRNLVIDTGAYPSIVSRDVAKKLRLSGHREELRVVDHNLNSQTVSVPHLQVGPIQVSDVRVMVQNLGPLSAKFGARIDAVIGLDVLAHSSFRIDYGEKTMVFGRVDPLPFAVPLHWRARMACVDIKINNQETHLLIDTGAANHLLFSQRLPWLKDSSGRMRASTNLGGDFDLREVKVDRLELGNDDLVPREVFVSDTKNMSPYPFDGMMATGALRQIAFDFERQQFSWLPARMKEEPLRAARSSINLTSASRLTSQSPQSVPPEVSNPCASNSLDQSTGRCAGSVQIWNAER
jgi:hypothetical protein